MKNVYLFVLLALSVTASAEEDPKWAELIAKGDFGEPYYEDYRWMLSNGATVDGLLRVHPWFSAQLADEFRSKRAPIALLKEVGTSIEWYSITAARAHPDYKKGADDAKTELKRRLALREHLHCTGPDVDYKEGIEVVDTIDNPDYLYNILWIDDALQLPTNQKRIIEMLASNVETGGILRFENDKAELIEIRQRPRDDAADTYQQPKTHVLVPNLGMFHTHPLAEGERASDTAGPSGEALVATHNRINSSDLDVLVDSNRASMFFIDLVFSEVAADRFNADIYFRELQPTGDGKATREPFPTVLDLGVFPATSE